jgi:hypothetical protein
MFWRTRRPFTSRGHYLKSALLCYFELLISRPSRWFSRTHRDHSFLFRYELKLHLTLWFEKSKIRNWMSLSRVIKSQLGSLSFYDSRSVESPWFSHSNLNIQMWIEIKSKFNSECIWWKLSSDWKIRRDFLGNQRCIPCLLHAILCNMICMQIEMMACKPYVMVRTAGHHFFAAWQQRNK